MESDDAPHGARSEPLSGASASGLTHPAVRYLRLGLLLACLLGAVVLLLDTRAGLFGLGGGAAQAGNVPLAPGCAGRQAPEVTSVSRRDLETLRGELLRIMPARVGRLYEEGTVTTGHLFTDDEPRFSPSPAASAPAAYEIRWWALDRAGSEDDVGADALEFATPRQAADALALATTPRCRRHGAALALGYPAGARELFWVNPDHAREWDVMFVRGRRLYRVGDVPPALLGVFAEPPTRLDRTEVVGTAQALACALPDAGCPSSLLSLRDSSLATLGPDAGTGAGPVPTQARASAYAHAVNLRGYDVPGMTEVTREAPTRDRGYWEAFTRCTGERRPASAVAAVHSPAFRYSYRGDYQLVYSAVAVLRSGALARLYMRALESGRARACMAGGYEHLLRAHTARDGQRHLGPARLTRLPTPAPPSYRGSAPYRATAVRLTLQDSYPTPGGGHAQLPLYIQGFAFAWGRAVVELTSITLEHPFPAANERFLESQLLGSAEASEASL